MILDDLRDAEIIAAGATHHPEEYHVTAVVTRVYYDFHVDIQLGTSVIPRVPHYKHVTPLVGDVVDVRRVARTSLVVGVLPVT